MDFIYHHVLKSNITTNGRRMVNHPRTSALHASIYLDIDFTLQARRFQSGGPFSQCVMQDRLYMRLFDQTSSPCAQPALCALRSLGGVGRGGARLCLAACRSLRTWMRHKLRAKGLLRNGLRELGRMGHSRMCPDVSGCCSLCSIPKFSNPQGLQQ